MGRILENHDCLLNSSFFSSLWQNKYLTRRKVGEERFVWAHAVGEAGLHPGKKEWWGEQLMSAAGTWTGCCSPSRSTQKARSAINLKDSPRWPASSSCWTSPNISIHQGPSIQTHALVSDIPRPSLQHGFPKGNQDPSTGSLAPHLCPQHHILVTSKTEGWSMPSIGRGRVFYSRSLLSKSLSKLDTEKSSTQGKWKGQPLSKTNKVTKRKGGQLHISFPLWSMEVCVQKKK